METCPRCRGNGYITITIIYHEEEDWVTEKEEICSRCNGDGEV